MQGPLPNARRGTARRTAPKSSRLLFEQLEPRLLMTASHGELAIDPLHEHFHYELCDFPVHAAPEPEAVQAEHATAPQNASLSRFTANAPAGLPQLASRPGAAATLFLDFDGHFERDWGGHNNVYTPAYDTDGSYTSFSAAEVAAIREIWARVAEDYAPFNINVTTIDPGASARVARVAIGGNHSDWLGSPAGGVAYVGGFWNSAPSVAYVFEDALGNGDPRYTAEAASHEAGHLFGLTHQATWKGNKLVEEYNSGNGNWAPIMGVGYYADRTTWHSGSTNVSAVSRQDDLSILAGPSNGFGYVPDDHGNATTSASILPVSGGQAKVEGLIGKSDDRDVFKFQTPGGPASLRVDVAQFGANLDAVLELWNASGRTIASANPSNSQGASLAVNLSPGTYYVVVRSSGSYGNMGSYTLSGAVNASAQSQPEIAVASGGSLANGDTLGFGATSVGTPLTRTITITNVGGGRLSLSPIRATSLPAGFTLVQNIGVTSLAAGQSTSFTVRLDATKAGSFGGQLSIPSSDKDTPTFQVKLAGTVQAGFTGSSTRIIDNGDAGFQSSGAWMRATGAGHGKDIQWAPAGSKQATATWTFNNLEPGQYRISATWPGSRMYASDARYTILSGGRSLGAAVVNQQRSASTFAAAGSAWQNLGTFTVSGTSLTVQLSNSVGGRAVADAIRIERVYSSSGGTAFRIPLPTEDEPASSAASSVVTWGHESEQPEYRAAVEAAHSQLWQTTLLKHWDFALAGAPSKGDFADVLEDGSAAPASDGTTVSPELLADLAIESLLDEE